MQKLKDARRMLSKTAGVIADIEGRQELIRNFMATLKKAGIERATLSWGNKRYLYLIYPTKPGEARVRRYVGNNPAKVRDAIAKVERCRHYDYLESILADLNNSIDSARSQINIASTTLDRALAGLPTSPLVDIDSRVEEKLAGLMDEHNRKRGGQ